MIKKLLLVIACFSTTSFAQLTADEVKFDAFLADVQESSFTTGCIGGFLAVYELGMYSRPDKYLDGKAAFEAFKQDCIKKASFYRLEQYIMRNGNRNE